MQSDAGGMGSAVVLMWPRALFTFELLATALI